MANKEVLSLKDILKRKDYFKNKRNETKELYVKGLDGNIVVSKIDRDLYLEALDMERGEGDLHIVYNSIFEQSFISISFPSFILASGSSCSVISSTSFNTK